MVSAFAIGGARASNERPAPSTDAPSQGHAGHAHHGQATAPNGRVRRPVIPEFARLCYMDDRSAERFAAYKLGRGAEYDDKSAASEELRKKRGLPAPPAPDQSHSPVAQLVARKKAQQAKKAELAKPAAGAPKPAARVTPSR